MDQIMQLVNQAGSGNLKKIAFMVLDWICKQAGISNPIPGAAKGETSQKDFMSFLKDGTVLSKLANVLKPGAVDSIDESGTTEGAEQNAEKFREFAKNDGGVPDSMLYKAKDLVSGKGFSNVLGTLMGLGSNSQEKFGKSGLDMDSIQNIAMQAAGKGFLNNLLAKFKK